MRNKTLRIVSLIIILCLGSLSLREEFIPQPAQATSLQISAKLSLSGWFTIIWGDKERLAEAATVVYLLTNKQGQTVQLLIDENLPLPSEGIVALNQQWVTVEGQWSTAPLQNQESPRFVVQALELDQAKSKSKERSSASLTGSQPWLSILCKFADVVGTPKALSYFQNMYGSSYPGLDHYWREQSYHKINLTGSMAVGWYTLPYPRSYYISSTGANLALLFDHCTAAADAAVYFPNYVGVNLMFNAELDGSAWGGSYYTTLDGLSQLWYTTWEPPWGYSNLTVMAHEMGHGFGLPHSGVDGHEYDNSWDIMSEGWDYCALQSDPTYGCLGQHTIAYHKDKLGWIPATQKYRATGGQLTLTLEQLALPQSGNYKMVQIPIEGSTTHFYTVEARRRVGYDTKLPGQAIIIHEVKTTRTVPADVLDPGGPINAGELGAMWTAGEIFTDGARGISISVDAATASGFVVTITSPSFIPTSPSNLSISSTSQNSLTLSWQDNSNSEDGFKIYRWDGVVGEFIYWASVGSNITTFTDLPLNCDWEYFYQVSAYQGDDESPRTDWIKGVVDACPVTDGYEPDDSSSQAAWIEAGAFQTHNIVPADDQDWVKFWLSTTSEVVIETLGSSGDTRLWLYNYNLNQIEFDDNDGLDNFSRIDRLCGTEALPEGTYYIRVDESGHDNEIASYDLSLATSPCLVSPELRYNGYSVDDDTFGNSHGDNDGLIECQEGIELYVQLYNQGDSTAMGINTTLYASDPYLTTLYDTNRNYPDIPAASAGINYGAFYFALAPDTPNGHLLHFNLTTTAFNGGPWYDSFSIPVRCNMKKVFLPVLVR